ncbi:conserved exported protein of unknown function [Pseudodesulfovibrio profundus]|uniref:Tim44-like domain-containing protein n=1 Tax=Pseudodesulfovibrio profundus TaxID=57320 RepID=A0A2C8F5H2_9BACT|nr:TIM44-like domain-containing protein [Pseudodesulfovibrio profundus]SOB57069.1 conserved exported protein of unknown function [Pseudodesulfovibrio profundus]
MIKTIFLLRSIGTQVFSATVASVLMLLVAATPALANQQAPATGGSVLNILLLALIAYFLVRMFRRRSGGDDSRPGNWTQNDSEEKKGRVIRPMDRHEAARSAWDHLRSDSDSADVDSHVSSPVETGGFNEAEFLEGAKLFFSRFQQAADDRDFEQLKVFLSDEVYADAVLNAQNNPGDVTEIMLLNARMMEMKQEDNKTFATVFYDAQVRKGGPGGQSQHLRSVWEFSRDDSVDNGLWTLEKINKVDQ